MISSMTGFSRQEYKENDVSILVELRSVNHRFLDIEARLPKNLAIFEQKIREIISTHLGRGRITVTVTVKNGSCSHAVPKIDKSLAANYLALLRELQKDLKLEESIGLEHLLTFPEIISFEENGQPDEALLSSLRKCVEGAIVELKEMRQKEGQTLRKDFYARIKEVDNHIDKIKSEVESHSGEVYSKLKERVALLTDSHVINEGRLEMEVALLAEKTDVTEECTRFKSHIEMFLDLLKENTSEGRKLNFLLQEMHREANTIGAKANNAQISHWIIQIKEEIEKLREQVQNIE